MGTDLFAYKAEASIPPAQLLAGKGKAAITHSADAGKFFTGFRVYTNRPDKMAARFSLSEYIFKTRMNNPFEAVEGYARDGRPAGGLVFKSGYAPPYLYGLL